MTAPKNGRLPQTFPQHHQSIIVRHAQEHDVEGVKRIADQGRDQVGFVNRAALLEAQKKGWLLVAVHDPVGGGRAQQTVVGFVNYRIRLDRICTLYEIAVAPAFQHQGIGGRLIQTLIRRAHEARCTHVQLKCPEDLTANGFYASRRFECVGADQGKRRSLNIWRYSLVDSSQESTDAQTIRHAEFFASLTVKPDEIIKLHSLWHAHAHQFDWRYGTPNPFERVLISPVVAKPRTFAFVRAMKESGETREVMFDSGGYFVQRGDLTFYDLMHRLEALYRTEDWADYYVLPDNPPLSNDEVAVVDAKVQQTVEGSLRLYHQLPSHIQERAMPVVHGTRNQHIDYCLQHYLYGKVHFPRVGFGSFPTSGSNNTINRLNAQALLLLKSITEELSKRNVGLHSFGISTPPAIYLLSLVGVTSFDSNGWMRSGGYGKIYLPFTRGYLVTFNSRNNDALSEHEFEHWKDIAGHKCPFCASFAELSKNRWYRILHNIVVMAELETQHRVPKLDMLKSLSFDYYRLFEQISRN